LRPVRSETTAPTVELEQKRQGGSSVLIVDRRFKI